MEENAADNVQPGTLNCPVDPGFYLEQASQGYLHVDNSASRNYSHLGSRISHCISSGIIYRLLGMMAGRWGQAKL